MEINWSHYVLTSITAQLVQQQAMDCMAGAQFPAETTDFSLLHNVQTSSEAHLASCTMGTRGSLLGDKMAEE
jgi:hypothetical protein